MKTTQVLQLEAEEKRSLSVTLCRFLVPEARTLGINNEVSEWEMELWGLDLEDVVLFYFHRFGKCRSAAFCSMLLFDVEKISRF